MPNSGNVCKLMEPRWHKPSGSLMALASVLVPLEVGQRAARTSPAFQKDRGSLTVTLTRSSKVHGQIRDFFFFFSAKLCTKRSLQTGESQSETSNCK